MLKLPSIICIILFLFVLDVEASDSSSDITRIGYVPTLAFTPESGSLFSSSSCVVKNLSAISYIPYPSFNRMALSLSKGEIDIAFNISPTPTRNKTLSYLGDLIKYRVIKVLRIDDDSNNNKIVGVRLGDSIAESFVDKNSEYILIRSTELLVSLFISNKIQGFIEVEPLIYEGLKKISKNNIPFEISTLGYERAGIYANNNWKKNYPGKAAEIKNSLSRYSLLLLLPYIRPD